MASTNRPYAAQPVYVDRAPAYPERYYAPERHYARERYYAQEYDYARNMRRGRRCPCPTVRGRDATTAMAGGPTAIEAAGIARVRCRDCDMTTRTYEALRAILDYRAGPYGGLATA